MIGIYVISGIMIVTAFMRYRVIVPVFAAAFVLQPFLNSLLPWNSAPELIVSAGLMLCFVGDIFLMIKELFRDERTSNLYLLLGVGSFTLAQIMFAIRFIMYADRFIYWLIPIVLIAPAILLISHKTNIMKLEKTGIGLIIYSVIIGFTTICALNLLIVNPSNRSVALFVALAAFMLSDTALCYTYYGRSVTLRRILNYVVMLFYYSATILLAYSILL